MDRKGRKQNKEESLAIFSPALGFKGRTVVVSGFSVEGTLNSASAVPHCGDLTRKSNYVNDMISLLLFQVEIRTTDVDPLNE